MESSAHRLSARFWALIAATFWDFWASAPCCRASIGLDPRRQIAPVLRTCGRKTTRRSEFGVAKREIDNCCVHLRADKNLWNPPEPPDAFAQGHHAGTVARRIEREIEREHPARVRIGKQRKPWRHSARWCASCACIQTFLWLWLIHIELRCSPTRPAQAISSRVELSLTGIVHIQEEEAMKSASLDLLTPEAIPLNERIERVHSLDLGPIKFKLVHAVGSHSLSI